MSGGIKNMETKRRFVLYIWLFFIMHVLSGCGRENQEPEEQAQTHVYVSKQLAALSSGGYGLPEGFQKPAVEGGQIYYMRQTYESQTVERAVFPEDDSAVDYKEAEILFSVSAFPFEKGGEGDGSGDEVSAMLDMAMDRGSKPVKRGPDGSVNVAPEKEYFSFRLQDYAVDQEQNVYFVLDCSQGGYFSMESRGSVLCKRTARGEWAYRRFFPGMEPLNDSLAVDGSGGVYMLTAGGILAVDRDGHETGMTGTEEYKGTKYSSERLLGDSQGNVYYFVLEEYDSRWRGMKVGQQGGTGLEEVRELSGSGMGGFGICAVFRGDVFFSVYESLYMYDGETGSCSEILQWTDSRLINANVRDCFPLGEDRLLVWYDERGMEGLYQLVKTPVEELPERETVVLAVLDVPMELRNAVIRFNRMDERYQVVLESYGYSYENASGAENRLGAALASSDPPDLLFLSGRNLEKDMEKGLLEDLSPYLEGSGVLDREDFLENALEGYTVGDSLVGIPVRFYATAVGGRTSQMGEPGSWTMEDVYALAERYPEKTILLSDAFYDAYTGKPRILGTSENLLGKFCAAWYLEEYVDWEKGKCDFDSEGFRRLLEWVGEHGEEPAPQTDSRGSISLRGYFPEEALLMEGWIEFEDIGIWEMQCGEELTLTGFPTADGKGALRLTVEAPLGIVAGAGNREGAWEFLEYYISSSMEGEWRHGLPVSRKRLGELMEKELQRTHPLFLDIAGETVEMYGTSRENAEKLMALLEAADFTPESGLRNMVVSIVLEETKPYYTGDKSLDEAVGIIQNRVQLLLEENQ